MDGDKHWYDDDRLYPSVSNSDDSPILSHRSRSNKKQISVLVDFMSTHNHLATGEFTGPLGAKRTESQWLVLKQILKEHGPDRSVDQWKQTWKDIKKGARAENAAAARGLNATGNAQPVPSVSDTSTKILNIIGHDCSTGIGPEESVIGVADSIDNTLKERNNILREQNVLLREQNAHLARVNKLKRLKRYEKTRRLSPYASPKAEERERRSTLTVLAKFFLFCTAMILFCVLLYIPVYNKANDQLSKGLVAGWSIHTNRDTKIYVQPNNVTTIHSPRNLCHNTSKNKLFLLIVVCSSTLNFERRVAIRETWGNYKSYIEMSKLYHAVKQKYINYNYTYDLYSENAVHNISSDRVKRDISSLSRLLPELAKALQDNLVNEKTDNVPEQRFEDEVMLPEFDMNQELGENTEPNYDYYDTNVMKIPPKGYEDNPDLDKVLSMLKGNKNFKKMKEKLSLPTIPSNIDPEYKVVFLLGLPTHDNDSTIQNKIEEESEKYGDVIQEGFIDSYNNLTLKSIMMLKWITNNCNNSVRYILKTDDDMYINVPNLIDNLRNRSQEFDTKTRGRNIKEYMLIGDLICGARPVLDSSNKWYSPRYMYGGRVYPKYLSGTGYALSADAARALYAAALRTNYFHLEDIFITGMCAGRAHPRIIPRDDPSFSYQTPSTGGAMRACGAHARATAHRVAPDLMRRLHGMLRKPGWLDTCERMRLTKVRRDRLKPKTPPKRPTKH